MPPKDAPVPDSPPSLGERVRAIWVVWAKGPKRAWMEALETRNLALARILEKRGVSAQGLDASAIIRAVEMADPAMLSCILKSGANPNQRQREGMLTTPLHTAALAGDMAKVKMLVAAGAHVDICANRGVTALATVLEALSSKVPALPGPHVQRQMVFCLLDLGASAKGWAFHQRESLLRLAPLDLDILDRLVAAGANPSRLINPTPAKGFKPVEGVQSLLFRAVEIQCLRKMEAFLAHLQGPAYRQGPHTRDIQGRTLPFEMVRSWVPSSGHGVEAWEKMWGLLARFGYDLAATDGAGNTLLHVWAQAMAPTFHDCGKSLLARPESARLLKIRNQEGQEPLDVLGAAQERLGNVEGGWQMLALATHDRMQEALELPCQVRLSYVGGRL